jgi:hypothetical protein
MFELLAIKDVRLSYGDRSDGDPAQRTRSIVASSEKSRKGG